ncbi:MAG: hypothetical protein R2822_10030 [Spirosomataceae bacterium]
MSRNETPIVTEPPLVDVGQNRPFTLEELHEKWEAFTRLRQQQGGAVSEQIMLSRALVLEATTIHLVLDNLHQETLLNEVKPQLLGYLRQHLHNRAIEISYRIAANEGKRNPYTPQEKFNVLAEQHPALRLLQQSLGLEVDF